MKHVYTFLILSFTLACSEPQKEEKKSIVENKLKETIDDCNYLNDSKDTVVFNGSYYGYHKIGKNWKAVWGNGKWERIFRDSLDCDLPTSVPWFVWSNKNFIGIKAGCGVPCWVGYVLPLSEKDSVQRYDTYIAVDTANNLIARIESNEQIIITDMMTKESKVALDSINDMDGIVLAENIDSVSLTKDKIYIKWSNYVRLGKNGEIKNESKAKFKF